MAVMREPTRGFDVELAPAWEMVDKHDARKGARTRWPGHVSRYRRSFVAFDGHVLAGHTSVERHRSSSMGLGLGSPSGRRSAGPSSRSGGELALQPEGAAPPVFDDRILGATTSRCRTRSAAHMAGVMRLSTLRAHFRFPSNAAREVGEWDVRF